MLAFFLFNFYYLNIFCIFAPSNKYYVPFNCFINCIKFSIGYDYNRKFTIVQNL